MILTDLFAQNVRGFGAQLHAKLAPGASELTPAPPHFAQLLRTLFYAPGFDPDANFAARPGEPARAGFIFTHEAQTYRLLRDLGTGAVQLALKTSELSPLATNAADVLLRLRAMGMPSAEAFDAIYALAESDFPSRRLAPQSGRTRAALEAAIATLRAKPRVARTTDALEFELDGLQKKKYGWEDLSQRRVKLASEVTQWEQRLSQWAWLEQIPADFEQRVAAFETAHKKRASELVELGDDNAERKGDEGGERLARVPLQPISLVRNWQFWAGITAGLVFLVLAMLLSGQARFVGLLDIGAFGWSVIVALQFVSESETYERYTHRVARREDVRRRIEEKFTADTQVVREVLAKANGATAKEIVEQLGQRDQLRTQAETAEHKLAAFDLGEGVDLRSWGAEQVESRISEIEEQLALAGDSPSDTTAQELAALERELANSGRPPPGPFNGKALVLALVEASGGELAQAITPLGARAGQFLTQWWGRPSVVFIDERGLIISDGAAFASLALEIQDQVWLALRLAAFELCAPSLSAALWIFDLNALPHLQAQWLTTYVPFVSQASQAFVCASVPTLGLLQVALS